MSARQNIIDAVKNRLESVSALGTVSYWRDCRVRDGEAATNFRDVASEVVVVNNTFEHRMRVEVVGYVFGEDLGAAMNTQLQHIFRSFAQPLPVHPRCVIAPVETTSQAAGDGHGAGVIGVVLEITYRTPTFDI